MTEFEHTTKVDLENGSPAFAKPVLYAGAVEKARISIYNEDCLQALKAMADKQFDLAIVDPPYGIGASADSRVGGSYTVNLGGVKKKVAAKAYTPKDWDFQKPTLEYWNELKRVSKNQIVWGGNYFASNLEDTSCWIVWNKRNGENNNADCELAWTSFKTAVRMFEWKWNGMLQQNMKDKEDRIHPTQKPVALYKWVLENYAEKGSKILDTHLGSGSIAIACWDMGYDLTAYEVDKEYYDNACKRLEMHKAQLTLW
jgi:site-specific DNA-methyltransferase (adenine-specific)